MMCEYYELHAKLYAEETFSADMSEQYRRFLPLLRERARILDVGSGSGRDACYFQKKGYQVTALEPSKNLCREIRKVFSGKIVCSDIQSYRPNQRFDGIWACASLLHVPEKELSAILKKIARALKDSGILYMSFKLGDFEGFRGERYFCDYTEDAMEEVLKDNDRFDVVKIWETEDVRSGHSDTRWLNVLVRKQ